MIYRIVLCEQHLLNVPYVMNYFMEGAQTKDRRFTELLGKIENYIKEPHTLKKDSACYSIEKIVNDELMELQLKNFYIKNKNKEVFSSKEPFPNIPDKLTFEEGNYLYKHSHFSPEKEEFTYFFKQIEFGNVYDIGKSVMEETVENVFEKLIRTNRLKTLFK